MRQPPDDFDSNENATKDELGSNKASNEDANSSEDGISDIAPGLVLAPPVESHLPEEVLLPATIVANRYRIEKRIGAGGMGVVYRAFDLVLLRAVAIKVLKPKGVGSPPPQQLLNEARAAVCMQLDCFVKIHDFGMLPNNQPYMVMEYLKGTTMREWLALNKTLLDVLNVFCAICEGIASVHERKIIHRDLKPENVFVMAGDKVKILDFGLAGLGEPPDTSTVERAQLPMLGAGRVGTRHYMAPEIWRGEKPTPQVDVFALGVMLDEALHQRAHGRTPPELSGIVQKALASDRANRYIHAGELLTALRGFMGASSAKTLLGASFGLPMLSYRLRRSFGYALAVLVLVIGVGAASSFRTSMVEIPGGSFTMGSTSAEIRGILNWCDEELGEPRLCPRQIAAREQPARQITIAPFQIDRTEVTNQDFAAWLNESLSQRKITVSQSGRLVHSDDVEARLLVDLEPDYHPMLGLHFEQGRFVTYPGLEKIPVTQVTWDAAQKYCRDHDKRLLTEAEWEWAAHGARQGFRFPWGNELPRCDGVAAARTELVAPATDALPARKLPLRCFAQGIGPRPVGTSAQDVSPQGVYDLGGNVAEWVQDPFVDSYLDCGACKNPVVPESLLDAKQPLRGFRGGSWTFMLSDTRATSRGQANPNEALRGVGFRCARDIP